MKIFSLNVRGIIANTSTRLALQKFCILYKSSFVFIYEPWMPKDNFPPRFWSNISMKLFAVNNRGNFIPNIWCACNSDLNPSIVDIFDQHISFSLIVDFQLIYFSSIYGSTSYL